jgi:FtsZ-interacting cell division protein ZipA
LCFFLYTYNNKKKKKKKNQPLRLQAFGGESSTDDVEFDMFGQTRNVTYASRAFTAPGYGAEEAEADASLRSGARLNAGSAAPAMVPAPRTGPAVSAEFTAPLAGLAYTPAGDPFAPRPTVQQTQQQAFQQQQQRQQAFMQQQQQQQVQQQQVQQPAPKARPTTLGAYPRLAFGSTGDADEPEELVVSRPQTTTPVAVAAAQPAV